MPTPAHPAPAIRQQVARLFLAVLLAIIWALSPCGPLPHLAHAENPTTKPGKSTDSSPPSAASNAASTDDKAAGKDKRPPVEVDPKLVEEPVRAVVSGKVVLLTEALARRDIKSYQEELEGQVVLETNDGRLLPIIPDWRGRALFQDARLRDRPVDLLVRQRRSIPHLQVLSIYTFDEKGTRQLTDYWCDICSIPMYEIKECECCQGPIRLRFQPKELPTDLAPAGGSKSGVVEKFPDPTSK